jgi:hypothetical protein
VLVGGAGRPLYGDRDAIRRDRDAYARAGLDYLVAGLRQARSVDELEEALAATADALGG